MRRDFRVVVKILLKTGLNPSRETYQIVLVVEPFKSTALNLANLFQSAAL